MTKRPAPEPIKLSSYPRDDVRYSKDVETRGTAYVYHPDTPQSPAVRVDLGDYDVTLLDYPAGTVFTVDVTARYGEEEFERTFRLRSTQDDDDVGDYTVGPGLVTEPGPWWALGRKKHSGFEFGVRVMGAVLAEE